MTSDPEDAEDDRSRTFSPTAEQTEGLLDLLLAHKSEHLREFLAQHGLARSGAKAELRTRLEQGLAAGALQAVDLLRLLDTVESWSNQHVYLYQAPAALSAAWMRQSTARTALARHGLEALVDSPVPLLAPADLTPSAVSWTPDRLVLRWVQGLQAEERLPEQDVAQGPVVLRAYRLRLARRLVAFDWDLLSGHAALMLARLPAARNYQRARSTFQRQLAPLIDLDLFTPVRVSRAIRRIAQSGEARCRQVSYQTPRGSRLALTSPTRSEGVAADPDLDQLGALLAGQASGLMGDFFWPSPAGPAASEIHTKIYGVDQRVAFVGEIAEGELRYVLSRIFHHSQASS